MQIHLDTSNEYSRWVSLLKLQAVMTFPALDSDAERRSLLVSAIGEAIATTCEIKPADDAEAHDLAYTRTVLMDDLNELGGVPALARSWPYNQHPVDRDFRSWFAAGAVLGLVWRMHAHHNLPGGASVRKALHILEENPRPMMPGNIKDLRAAFQQWRPVAHICGAFTDEWFRGLAAAKTDDWNEAATAAGQHVANHLERLVAAAEAYYDFGRSFVPQRAKPPEPILSEVAWHLTCDRTYHEPIAPAPLTEADLNAARGYRAPQQL